MPKRNSARSPENPVKKLKADSPEKETHILDLNDDCLEMAFSFLSLADFCALKETCHRFEPLADYQFRRQFRYKNFHVLSGNHCEKLRMIRLFGKLIHRLDVSGYGDSNVNHVLKEICTKCTQLKQLEVFGCNLEVFELDDVPKDLPEMDFLHLFECFGNDEQYARFINYFANSEKMEIFVGHDHQCSELRGTFLQRNFPRLKEINLHYFDDNKIFHEFFRLNRQIEKIEFSNRSNALCSTMDVIAKYCNSIESISMQCISASVPPEHFEGIPDLSRLHKLKLLCFDCRNVCPIASMINSLDGENSLETIHLFNGTMDADLCEALSKLTSLKTFHLSNFDIVNIHLLKTFIGESNLRCVSFIDCANFNYEDIAIIIEHSPQLEAVEIFQWVSPFPLEEIFFLQWVNARKKSNANFPLKFYFFHMQEDFSHSITDEQIAANADSLKLYIYAFPNFPDHFWL